MLYTRTVYGTEYKLTSLEEKNSLYYITIIPGEQKVTVRLNDLNNSPRKTLDVDINVFGVADEESEVSW